MITLSCDYCGQGIKGKPEDYARLTDSKEVSLNGKKVIVQSTVTAPNGHICRGCSKDALGLIIGKVKTRQKTKTRKALTIDDL